ncbi:MAG: class I SAM-dependent methyltransferase [Elusimicrobiales bacterium]|nr:class I SAM-dependent methyltransferase [Elusimicrobiales bacterium]
MTGLLSRLSRWLIKSPEEGLRVHKAVMRLLAGVKASSLLDVGCGRAAKTEVYAALLGVPLKDVAGIETNRAYAEAARSKISVYDADIERAPFPFADESFDLVICNQVLEHLKNIYRPLAEMDRVVKTGGWLLLGVPNLAGLYNRGLLLLGRQPLSSAIDGPHVRSFAHSAMLAFLRRNPNFRVADCAGSNLYPLPWPLLELVNGRFPGFSTFSFYLLKKVRHDPAACGWKPGPSEDTVFD